MNLKEAFRYQKYLESLMNDACYSIADREHSLRVTKKHLMKAANPEAEDKIEEVEPDSSFSPNDDVIRFMDLLICEKARLSEEIGRAKEKAPVDIDASIEANKFRQRAADSVKRMLRFKGGKKTERGQGWKFNNEGVQSPYYYDVEVESADNFDREASRRVMREWSVTSDKVSSDIDAALINTVVEYTPPFDVNASFEDAMAEFLMS